MIKAIGPKTGNKCNKIKDIPAVIKINKIRRQVQNRKSPAIKIIENMYNSGLNKFITTYKNITIKRTK